MPLRHKELYELTELAELLIDTAPATNTDERMGNWGANYYQLSLECKQHREQLLGLLPPILRADFKLGLGAILHLVGVERKDFPLETAVADLRKFAAVLGAAAARQQDADDAAHPPMTSPSALERVRTLLTRFHGVQAQLRKRQDRRDPLVEINDEYDVQDLLHALLRIDFDDIRNEDWVPEYAGGKSRVDFLLKAEQIVIEVKLATETLKDKELGKQLIVDIARYRAHPDCKTLVCFIYDPEHHVANPEGLRVDLQKLGNGLHVVVLIAPRH
jgi:hypothetical protein